MLTKRAMLNGFEWEMKIPILDCSVNNIPILRSIITASLVLTSVMEVNYLKIFLLPIEDTFMWLENHSSPHNH